MNRPGAGAQSLGSISAWMIVAAHLRLLLCAGIVPRPRSTTRDVQTCPSIWQLGPTRRKSLIAMQITLMGLLDSRPDRSAVDIYIDELTAARDQGFRRMWTTQLMWEPDLLTVMAAGVGQVDGIEVGTAVLPVQVQHPTLLAQRALVVNQVAGGRLHLGLGVNHPGITEEMWG